MVGPEGGLGHPQALEVCLLPRMGFPWRWGPGEGGRSAAGCQGGAQVGAECRPRLALQASGRRSPEPCGKPDKVLKRGAYDKVGARGQGVGSGPRVPERDRPAQACPALCPWAGPPPQCRCRPQAYTDELVELHRRLMALRERNVLQQVPGGRRPGPRSWPRTRVTSEGVLGRGARKACKLPPPPPPPPPSSSSSGPGPP